MKELRVSTDIVSISKFKTQASQIFHRLREDRRPVVVTQNGQPAGVLITPEDYDQLQEHDRFMTAVREGLVDSESGRLIDDEDLSRQLEAEFDS